jgi:predicted enzyme related to lactoylglutathione lyase
MANPFVHAALNAADPGKAPAFCTALFDWTLQDIITDPTSAILGPWKPKG